jgi:hypothetical protein
MPTARSDSQISTIKRRTEMPTDRPITAGGADDTVEVILPLAATPASGTFTVNASEGRYVRVILNGPNSISDIVRQPDDSFVWQIEGTWNIKIE